MNRKKILFISGSIGLGHVTRDLAIARELRTRNPQIEISWLAANPASSVLEQAGERVLPEANQYADENMYAENAANGARLNILKYLLSAREGWSANAALYKRVVSEGYYDLIIADEAYEIVIAWGENSDSRRIPFVMIYDFVGL
jgi:UDP:flavonoid glycosyltransferase YjiC (YdhE family)